MTHPMDDAEQIQLVCVRTADMERHAALGLTTRHCSECGEQVFFADSSFAIEAEVREHGKTLVVLCNQCRSSFTDEDEIMEITEAQTEEFRQANNMPWLTRDTLQGWANEWIKRG